MTVKCLVVSVSEYQEDGISNLPAVVTDAELVTGLFEELGFRITPLQNPTRNSLFRSITGILNSSNNSDDLIIYFSGHGIGYENKDYLLPSDAYLEDPSLLEQFLIPVDLFGALRNAKAASVLMIIDACRDGIRSTLKGDTAAGFYYSNIEPNASQISIVYSCRQGESSQIVNLEIGSLFTAAFVSAIAEKKYGRGTIRNVLERTQHKIDEIAENYGKRRQITQHNMNYEVSESLERVIFPNTQTALNPRFYEQACHDSSDFLYPDFTYIYNCWKSGFDGRNVGISVLSGRVFHTHEEFSGKKFLNVKFGDAAEEQRTQIDGGPLSKFATILKEKDFTVNFSTGLLGILFGRNLGIVRQCDLTNFEIIDKDGNTEIIKIIQSLNEIAISDDDSDRKIVLFPLEIADSSDAILHFFDVLIETSKTLVIVAAGNNATRGINILAKNPSIISVGAVNRNREIEAYNDFRQHGHPEPTLYGLSDILAPSQMSELSYQHLEGSAVAAAYVAGIAALVWSAHPSMDASALRSHLIRRSMRIADMSAKSGLAVADCNSDP